MSRWIGEEGEETERESERVVLEIDVGVERRGASSGRLICFDYKQGGILTSQRGVSHPVFDKSRLNVKV